MADKVTAYEYNYADKAANQRQGVKNANKTTWSEAGKIADRELKRIGSKANQQATNAKKDTRFARPDTVGGRFSAVESVDARTPRIGQVGKPAAKKRLETGDNYEPLPNNQRRRLPSTREVNAAMGQTVLADGEMEELIVTPPERPIFPLLILLVAVGKDIIDMVSLTGFGYIITLITSFMFALVLFIWMIGKIDGRWWKRGVLRWLWKRLLIVVALEFLLPFLPMATIFILMAHYREKKIVIMFNKVLEELHNRGYSRLPARG